MKHVVGINVITKVLLAGYIYRIMDIYQLDAKHYLDQSLLFFVARIEPFQSFDT